LFTDSFIEAFAKHYVHILELVLKEETLANNPNIKDCEFISKDEKALVKKFGRYTEAIIEVGKENYYQRFLLHCKNNPNKSALIYAEQRLSYQNLFIQVENCASYFTNSGLKQNSTLALLMPRSIEVPVVMLACAKLVIQFVPLNHLWPSVQIKQALHNIQADALYIDVARKPELLNSDWLEQENNFLLISNEHINFKAALTQDLASAIEEELTAQQHLP